MKQAANNWYKELANFLLGQWFIGGRKNHSLFERAERGGHNFILVWVGDIIVASRSKTFFSELKNVIEPTFQMDDRRGVHCFMDLRIRRGWGKVAVDQEPYIERVLELFHLDQCKPSRTPAYLNLSFKATQKQNADGEVDQKIWRNLVGSFLHLPSRRC